MSVKPTGWLASSIWGFFITPIVLIIGNILMDLLPESISMQLEQLINNHIIIFVMIAYSLSVLIFRRLEINPLEEKDWL